MKKPSAEILILLTATMISSQTYAQMRPDRHGDRSNHENRGENRGESRPHWGEHRDNNNQPTQPQPTRTEPTHTWRRNPEPTQPQPTRTEPTHTWRRNPEPTRTEPARTWPTPTEPTQPQPTRTEPTHTWNPTQPSRTEPTHTRNDHSRTWNDRYDRNERRNDEWNNRYDHRPTYRHDWDYNTPNYGSTYNPYPEYPTTPAPTPIPAPVPVPQYPSVRHVQPNSLVTLSVNQWVGGSGQLSLVDLVLEQTGKSLEGADILDITVDGQNTYSGREASVQVLLNGHYEGQPRPLDPVRATVALPTSETVRDSLDVYFTGDATIQTIYLRIGSVRP